MAADTQLKIFISSILDGSGFNNANKSIGDIGVSLKSLDSVAKKVAGSIAGYFAFSSFKDGIKGALDFAESINHVRQSSGMSADQLYALSAAAKLADVDFQSLTGMTSKFEKGLGDATMGTGNAKKALDHLGLSLRDSKGNMVGSYEQLSKIADKFKELPDGASKTTMAIELFGKAGAAMIPILNSGSAAIREYLGIMDDKTAQAAENFNDSMTRVSMASNTVYTQMTASLAPTLNAIADDFNLVSKEGIKTGHTLGSDLAEGMKVAIDLAYTVAGTFTMAGHAIGNFGAAAVMLSEGDFSGAKFAWNKISKDADIDQKSWNNRIDEIKNAKPSDINDQTGSVDDDKGYEDKVAEREAERKAKKAATTASKIQNSYSSMYSELYKMSHTEYENEILDIDNKAKKYLQEGVSQVEVTKFTEKAKAELREKYISEANAAQVEYYTAIGNASAAYYLQEEEKIKKLAKTGWYTNEQMLAIEKADNEKFQKEQWAKDNKFWADLFDNINKAMEEQFFNAMTGKFKSFGSWLKDFWGAITSSMARGLSKSLADLIIGTGSSGGGIVNIFRSFGGLAGATGAIGTLVGTTLSAADYTTVISKYGLVDGKTVTPDGTTIDSAGKITAMGSGSDLGTLLNTASSLKTAYTAITSGLSSSIANAFASGAAYTYNGLTAIGVSADTAGSIAGGIGNFGAGLSAPWTSAGASGATWAGATVSGAVLGAVGGYAIGAIGDALFGADTKASSYGAIGGAIGSFLGPIGAVVGSVLGSIIGGIFGTTKVTGSGYYFKDATTTGENGKAYTDYQKKSWFKSSSWTSYKELSDVDKMKIKGLFDTYDYLFTQLGSSKIVELAAGKYSSKNFQDSLAKDFISEFTGISQTILATTNKIVNNFGESLSLSAAVATQSVTKMTNNPEFKKIYSYWVDYAKSINKTVAEALATTVGVYISEKRTFQEWKLGSGTPEQLKFTADYLSKDLSAIEAQMGVNGVTVDNYLGMYDAAVKKNFTPETINSWKALGDALMSATNANQKYTDSLKALTANTPTIPPDMILSKSLDGSQLFSTISTQSDTMMYSFAEMITLLRKMLYNQQFGIQPI